MASVNLWIGIGHLGGDAEVKYLPSGQAVCEFSIACDESYTDKQGQKVEKVEWLRIKSWGRLAETCGQYLKKGRQVYVEGKISTRSYDDKDGNKRYITEIVAKEVKFLGSRDGGGQRDGGEGGGQRGGSHGGGGGRSSGSGGARGGGGGGGGGGYDPPPDFGGGGDDEVPF